MKSNLLPISQEGLKYLSYLGIFLLVTLLFNFDFLSLITLILLVATAFLFRNPERSLPTFEVSSVVSPVDGVVKSIEELSDSEYAYKVEIESSYAHVSVLRAPLNATVKEIQKYNGTRVSSSSKLYNDTNERVEIVFVDDSKRIIKIVHRLKKSVASISTDLLKAQNIRQTSRYGTMINGVTTLYLPHNFRISVNIGNELKASESLMGYFS